MRNFELPGNNDMILLADIRELLLIVAEQTRQRGDDRRLQRFKNVRMVANTDPHRYYGRDVT